MRQTDISIPESAHLDLEQLVHTQAEELAAVHQQLRDEINRRKHLEAELQRLSVTDELTGLSNRRGFLLRAEQQLKLVPRLNAQGWLIYLELDGIKPINAELGHDVGDQLIKNTAKVLRETFRESDVIARIGSDEFIVFATSSSTPVEEIQGRLDEKISHHNNFFPDQPQLSINIGIIHCNPHALDSLDDMIHQADAAMYIEKRRKRAYLHNNAFD
ncbi:GGDEF domain-containing protein [Acidicapsa ligni]|uniref:GGDEF domain-containing protein n=1 Tax=Acidicapsa ligni TaxID=542300 RepID=UPI0021DF5ADC|nr:GGDEF domain-containing protein [Acidicapsa ligni]